MRLVRAGRPPPEEAGLCTASPLGGGPSDGAASASRLCLSFCGQRSVRVGQTQEWQRDELSGLPVSAAACATSVERRSRYESPVALLVVVRLG
jgi:hypothetical protein